MPQLNTTATFSGREVDDDALTTIVARSVLEAALREGEEAELWLDLERGGESARLDGEAVEGLFGDPDVEAHGLKGALAIAVTSAAILAPAGHAALPQTVNAATTVQRANPAATTQVSSLASRAQVSGAQAKTQVSKQLVVSASGLRLLRGGFAR
jgi:hypothetical protein